MIIVAHPLTLTLYPEAGERGFLRLHLPLGEGWGEGAFPRIDAQSCYDVRCVPSFETFSTILPRIEHAWQSLQLEANEPGRHVVLIEVEISHPCLGSSWLTASTIGECSRCFHAVVNRSVC